jgi:2-polyprenyl-3-methyl-5-hydroxy-6-metoxy-1,4-benzoquinol methylase
MMNSTTSRFLATDPDEYEHFMGRWSRRLTSPFLEFAGTKPGDRVLDVGCGTGILTSALAERGSTVVGIDASEAYVAEARSHRSNPEVTYDLGDVRHLPYADSSLFSILSPNSIRWSGRCAASRALVGSSRPEYSISGVAFPLPP